MEFEKNKPTTPEDITLASAPRVTVQPAHGEIRPELANSPKLDRPDKRNFEFETESTAETALTTPSTRHPHHHLALLLATAIVLLFVAAIAAFYFLR